MKNSKLNKDLFPFIVASRGRYNEWGIEQHFEPRFDGLTNTITTVQKDNYVVVLVEDDSNENL